MSENDALSFKDCKTSISSTLLRVEERLDSLIIQKDIPYKILFEASRYSLLSGGKRLRPLLLIATAEMFGADIKKCLDSACAIEMLHTYSMIHDDLPCMDDDDFRRGRPSLHKAFTEAHAVLAGDFLLTRAFEVIAEDSNLDNSQKVKLIKLLTSRGGSEGMIGGQVMDIDAEGKEISLAELQQIHNLKTGALIAAALEMGAIIGQASDKDAEIVAKFGLSIGLAFQIIDDILDVTSSKQKHGRELSSDQINNKTTYATAMDIETAKDTAIQLIKSAKDSLLSLSYSCEKLLEIADFIVARRI